MLRKGCSAYLAPVIDIEVREMRLEDILIVKEFSDIFSYELPWMPPNREIEFSIDLVPATILIFIALYMMASTE